MHFSKYCLIFILFTQLGFSENTKHPNLLLNEKEIEDIRQNIKKHKWSRDLFTRLKTEVDKKSPGEKSGQGLSVAVRGTALMYAITKDKAYAEMAWKHLQGIIPSWTTGSNTGPYATGAEHAIMYDLIYTALTDEQRTSFEVAVKARGRHLINYANKGRQTWSMFFRFHSEVGVLGYLIGDKELIEWGLNDPGGGVFEKYGKKHYGGYYQMMEAIFRDGLFQSATTYGLVDVVPHMVILAEAAWHNGHDLWNWSSPEGDTLAKGFESWLDTTFPAEATTMGKGSFRIASYGDAGNHPEAGRDTYLFNYPHSIAVGHRNSEAGWLYEIAYKRTKNPKFAWIVNSRTRRGRSDYLFIYPALTHGVHVEPKDMILPKARSRVLADASNVMLRADESSNYWYGRGMACFMKMGNFPSYSHSSDDAYEIILHAKGRLIYPDVDVIQYENRSAIGWTAKTIAHNSLVVDGGNAMGAPFTYRNDFSDAVKFVSVTGAPYQKKGLSMDAAIGSRTYPKNVQLSRALFLTSDYMVDLFWAKSAKEHVYDWALHGMGRLIFDKKTYKRSDDLA
ncbi:MAG: alginate lyase family protein, partial [Lentisphaeria bacterium]|nr:alginate lyase family protein [Lentisphaeria bacterium]NQZ71078.1 alginate lyase family protein [Lentisphaeria bacterium]